MSRALPLLLGEVLEAIALVRQYTTGLTYTDFANSMEKQDAVVRRLSVIGEAVKRLPEAFRRRHPDVPWRTIAGARDILVHEYFRVDVTLAWEMAQTDLPDLERQIRAIMAAEGITESGTL